MKRIIPCSIWLFLFFLSSAMAETTSYWLDSAAKLVKSGNIKSAEQAMFKAVKTDPSDGKLWVALANFYGKTKQYKKVLKVTKKIKKSFPNHVFDIMRVHNFALRNLPKSERTDDYILVFRPLPPPPPPPPEEVRRKTVREGISERCYNKWRTDYEMVEYCIQNQLEAYGNLKRNGF